MTTSWGPGQRMNGGAGWVAALVLGGALLTAGGARAAVTVVTQRSGGTATMYVDGDHARIENPPAGSKASAIIIDAAAKKMILIDDAARTYTEITDADVKQLKGQFAGMRAQMEERMKTMSPEQRTQMEAMMAKMGQSMGQPPGAAPPAKTVWKFDSLGQKKTVNGIACQMYRVSRNGAVHEEDCISPWSAGLVKKSDFEGLRKFGEEMIQGLGADNGRRAEQLFDGLEQYPGLPITRQVLHEDGTKGDEEQIKSISRAAIPAAKFALPAGYTKKDFAAMSRGARHGGPPGQP